jgi:hypothetical protein
MASQMNRLLRELRMAASPNPRRVGSQPADWATMGRVTRPGPVMFEMSKARPPQKEISLMGWGSKRTFWKEETWLRMEEEEERREEARERRWDG